MFTNQSYPPLNDIVDIVGRNNAELKLLSGKKICIIGGSGFIGTWLANTLIEGSLILDLDYDVIIAGRSKKRVNDRLRPGLEQYYSFTDVDFVNETSIIPMSDVYFHAATPSSVSKDEDYDQVAAAISVNSTEALLRSLDSLSPSNIIHLSSGAVYGDQSFELEFMPEKELQASSKTLSVYAKSKIEIENLLNQKSLDSAGRLKVSNPRLFAFLGPLLPLDSHFAAGNFMNDAIHGRSIDIAGSPLTKRSYLYPTDLISALLSLAIDPYDGPLNIGSETPITMSEFGTLFSRLTDNSGISMKAPDSDPSNYVPRVKVLKEIYGWEQQVNLEDGIQKWWDWLNR